MDVDFIFKVVVMLYVIVSTINTKSLQRDVEELKTKVEEMED